MKNFFKKWLGKSQVEIEGLNQNRHLEKLCKSEITLYNVLKKSPAKMQLEVENINLKKVKTEFSSCAKCEVVKQTGLLKILNDFKKNLIIIITFCLCALSFPIINMFVLKTQIVGCDLETKQQIINLMFENNYKSGNNKKHYDLNLIENLIYNNLTNIALVDAQIKGQTLILSVKEKVNANVLKDAMPIINEFDGIVEQINLTSGTAKVKAGDFVKAGEILVEPYIIRNGKFFVCLPKAEIKVRCFFSNELIFYENKQINVRTGKKVVKNNFTYFKNFDKLELGKIEFELYETNIICENKKTFPLLPLKLTSIEVFELTTQNIYENFEENKNRIEEEFKNKTINQINATKILSQEITSEKLEEGVYKIKCYVDFNKTY